MKLNTSLSIITLSFIISLAGFIISVVLPQNHVSDLLMIAALFSVSASGIVSKIFTKSLQQSKHWKYLMIGGLMVLLSFAANYFDFVFLHQMLLVSGAVISITTFVYFFYLRSSDFKDTKWVWFIPFILLGYLFKHMRWWGANVIILTCLLIISVVSIIQFIKLKKYSWIQLLLLLWMLAMCGCIGVFTLRYFSSDYFVIGSVFTWLALIDILLHHENNMLEDSEFN